MKSSVRRRLRGLIFTFALLAFLILAAASGLLVRYNSRYKNLLYNVTTASEFNQDFKTTIDLKMYYYVIESQYSDGLPLEEVRAAQQLAEELLSTTTEKDSSMAISSVLSLCHNLEEKIYQLRDTDSYDERQSQLENNIYVLTALIQEHMYNYLYYEAARLNVLQSQIGRRLVADFILIAAVTGLLVLFFTRRAVRLGRSITEPIAALCARVEGVNSGGLAEREPIQAEDYEICTLSRGFEQMVGRLNRQIQETAHNQERLRRTELALIQSQVNPHFLYNTMDTIIWLIEAEKTEEAVEMVSNLSSFFRHSLSRGEDVITLREPDSLEELKSMGVTEPEILLTADPALTLRPAGNDVVDSVLLRTGIPPRGRYLCFALRQWPGFTEKAPLFAQAARYAYEAYGLTPVFVSVEKGPDSAAGREAAQGLDGIPHYFLDSAGNAGAIIGALSRMEAVVSMRLHALIFAAGQGIPLAGVVYDPKVSAFLRYIGQETFTDLDALTAEKLNAMIDRAAAQAAHPEAQAAAVARLQEMEHGNVSTARRLLEL